MTYRERRERRAEQRREWGEGRAAKAGASFKASHDATEGIPFGQPILVGHHSEGRHRRAVQRSQAATTRGLEHQSKAADHNAAADTIERQLATSIYDDDADAIERLREKLAGLEAERLRMKNINKAIRKAEKAKGGNLETDDVRALGLSAEELTDLQRVLQAQPYYGLGYPPYALSNLGGNISRIRKRIKRLEAGPGPRSYREMAARFDSDCAHCGAGMAKGDTIYYVRAERAAFCSVECFENGGEGQ
tara:strand:+ start:1014 stop:1757 length:744 start_codon:yes stop_codon:yes gene_type:complete